MKTVFKDNLKTYICMSLFGVLMGISVGLTAHLPFDDLWGFAYWATAAYGFWMFSCSLFVILSEKRKNAVINTVLYVFFVYMATYACKRIYSYYHVPQRPGTTLLSCIFDDAFASYFGYCWKAVLGAGILAAMLFSGRVNSVCGKIVRCLPIAVMLTEGSLFGYEVIVRKQKLFYFLVDMVCSVLYYFIAVRGSFKEKDNDSEKTVKIYKRPFFQARVSLACMCTIALSVVVYVFTNNTPSGTYQVSIGVAPYENATFDENINLYIYNGQRVLTHTVSVNEDYPSVLMLSSGRYTLKTDFDDEGYLLNDNFMVVDQNNTDFVFTLKEKE